MAACCTAWIGCSLPSQPSSPSAILLDTDRSLHPREAALDQITRRLPGDAGALQALQSLLWGARHPLPLRRQALEALLVHNPAALWSAARRRYPALISTPLREVFCHHVISSQRRDMLGPLLQRWAGDEPFRIPRSTYDKPPAPEAAAILSLTDSATVEEALTSAATETSDPATFAAAWSLLGRRLDNFAVRELAGTWRGPIDFVRDEAEAEAVEELSGSMLRQTLAEALPVLGRLPSTPEGLRHLVLLRHDEARWADAVAATATLPASLAASVELRHLPLLRQHSAAPLPIESVNDAQSFPPRPELLAMLKARLHGTRPVPRDPDYARGLPAEVSPDTLSDADLMLAMAVLDAMNTPSVAGAWFSQLDADLADPTSEHGGLLRYATDGKPTAEAYAPARHRGHGNNQQYYSSDAMIDALPDALAHYHFHAAQPENAAYAGPGRGDLAFAHRLQITTLVLTPLDLQTLNVDLVLPDHKVLDLGTLTRPPRSANPSRS